MSSTTAPTDSPGGNEPGMPPLLLASLAHFWSVIEPLLQAAQPRTVCEIGIGQAEFTTLLLEHCRKNFCGYVGIDTLLDEKLKARETPTVKFFRDHSLAVLPKLPPQDVYFIDGDHNYYTVLNELRLAMKTPGSWPLVVLHDVSWPWGRRDHYCDPTAIPEAFRHAYSSKLGVMPGRNELGEGGFSGGASAYHYGAAEHEGGSRNGVLTAVEDFLREQPAEEWRLVMVPAIFGLGILYAPAHCRAEVKEQLERLAAAIAPVAGLMELLERNRVDLFLTYLRNVKDLQKLTEHSTSLLGNYHGLLAHVHALQKAYDELMLAAFPPSRPS